MEMPRLDGVVPTAYGVLFEIAASGHDSNSETTDTRYEDILDLLDVINDYDNFELNGLIEMVDEDVAPMLSAVNSLTPQDFC